MRLRAHRSLQLAVPALGLLSAASNCGFLVRAVSGHRGQHRVVRLTAGSGVLTLVSLWYAPGVGVAQRLQVLAISAWLIVLASVQARRPAA
jgi:hypothetical protein